MLPPDFGGGDAESRRLLKRYRRLGAEDRRSVRDFIEFLEQRAGSRVEAPSVPRVPQPEPRPPSESVIAAIKRLGRVYPMLDRERMLSETSGLMAAHTLQGRAAKEVIDDLEAMFERHYREFTSASDDV